MNAEQNTPHVAQKATPAHAHPVEAKPSARARQPAQMDSPPCPRCGGLTSLKQAKNGSQFWGCDRYPDCKGTAPLKRRRKPRWDARTKVALAMFLRLLRDPSHRRHLWERYIVDRTEARLAVELADDLLWELAQEREGEHIVTEIEQRERLAEEADSAH